ncbi:hypothetical protein HDU84_000372 [Entophlyctis sp. JEL0112]|nr:hypothetical protein HDU84_000372 [Entophlyctis sp. JEL0112]
MLTASSPPMRSANSSKSPIVSSEPTHARPRHRSRVRSIFGILNPTPDRNQEPLKDPDREDLSFCDTGSVTRLFDCECESRGLRWEGLYTSGQFSDVELIACGRVFKLHRAVLASQSDLFAEVFRGGSADGVTHILDVGGGSVINIDCAEACRVDGDCLEVSLVGFGHLVALRDLYSPAHRPDIRPAQLIPLALAACFLQVRSLVSFCIARLGDSCSTDAGMKTIPARLAQLDELMIIPQQQQQHQSHENQRSTILPREFIRLRAAAATATSRLLTQLLMHATNRHISASPRCGADDGAVGTASVESPTTFSDALVALLAAVPVRWLRYVVDSPSLCVRVEFERYVLLRTVARARTVALRSARPNLRTQWLGTDEPPRASSQRGAANSSAGGFFGMLLSTPVAAAAESAGFRSPRSSVAMSSRLQRSATVSSIATSSECVFPLDPDVQRRLGNLVGSGSSGFVDADDEALQTLQIFETALVYTFMTFEQLERVKQDGVVSDSAVLNSFWMQAELINRFTTPYKSGSSLINDVAKGITDIGPVGGTFRFTATFSGLRAFIQSSFATLEKGEKAIIASAVTKCAGIDYRVLISVELSSKTSLESGPVQHRHQAMKKKISKVIRKTKSLDDLNGSSMSAGKDLSYECAKLVEQQEIKEINEFWERFVLKATLQRNRVHGNGGIANSPSGGGGRKNQNQQRQVNSAPPVSYSIFKFDGNCSGMDNSLEPVTCCDFDGTGFVKTFAVPRKHIAVGIVEEAALGIDGQQPTPEVSESDSRIPKEAVGVRSKMKDLCEALRARVSKLPVPRKGSGTRDCREDALHLSVAIAHK